MSSQRANEFAGAPGARVSKPRDIANGRSQRLAYIKAALLFGAVAGLLLAPALKPGVILAPVDLLYESPALAYERPTSYDEPANPHLFDQAYQFVPWRFHAWSRLRAEDLPLWNPQSATGSPFVATLQSAVFYPINLLTLALPFRATLVASALLRLWIAGFGVYALMRRYGTSQVAGLISGMSFMLSSFLIDWLGHPHTNVAIWLPFLILAVEGLFTSHSRRAAMGWWPTLALVVGIQFLGGHIETSRDILLAAGLYAVVRAVQQYPTSLRAGLRQLALAASAVALGAGIAAIQLLPFLEWLPLSAEYQRRASNGLTIWSFHPREALALPLAIMPNLYGDPTWQGPYWSFNPWGSFNESALYAGLIPLSLAVGALAAWRFDPIVRAWTIIGGVALGLALQVPLLNLFLQIPGISLGHPGRLRLVAIFAVAILAGRGLDQVMEPSRKSQILTRRFLAAALGFTLTVAVLFNVLLRYVTGWNTRAISRLA